MPRRGIQPFDRVKRMALFSAGHTQQDVADRLNATQSGVSKVWRNTERREIWTIELAVVVLVWQHQSRIVTSNCRLAGVQHQLPEISDMTSPGQQGCVSQTKQCVEDSIRMVFIPEYQWEVLYWTNGTEAIAGTGVLLINIGPLQNEGMSCLLTRPGLVWDRTLDVLGLGEAQEDTRSTDTFRKSIRLQVEL